MLLSNSHSNPQESLLKYYYYGTIRLAQPINPCDDTCHKYKCQN